MASVLLSSPSYMYFHDQSFSKQEFINRRLFEVTPLFFRNVFTTHQKTEIFWYVLWPS